MLGLTGLGTLYRDNYARIAVRLQQTILHYITTEESDSLSKRIGALMDI